MDLKASRSLLREPPLALLGGIAAAQVLLIGIVAATGVAAPYAFLAGPLAALAVLVAGLGAIHSIALARRESRRRVIRYVAVAVLLTGIGLTGPLVAESAQEMGAVRDIARVGPAALREEGLAILEKYKNRGFNPTLVSPDEWGPALKALRPYQVTRFTDHVKVHMYGLETACWGPWILGPGRQLSAGLSLGEGVYWVRAEDYALLWSSERPGAAAVSSAAVR